MYMQIPKLLIVDDVYNNKKEKISDKKGLVDHGVENIPNSPENIETCPMVSAMDVKLYSNSVLQVNTPPICNNMV